MYIYINNIPYPHGKRCKNWSIHPSFFAKKMLSELGALFLGRSSCVYIHWCRPMGDDISSLLGTTKWLLAMAGAYPAVAICDIHAAPALRMALWAPSADFEPKRRACWEIWPGKRQRKNWTAGPWWFPIMSLAVLRNDRCEQQSLWAILYIPEKYNTIECIYIYISQKNNTYMIVYVYTT